MDFVTIHDLSRELNIPARVIRYRFHRLRAAGQMVEGADFRRDDYVDEQHFNWKINPLSFMRETATTVAPPPLGYGVDNQSGNKQPPSVSQPDTKTAESVTRQESSVNQAADAKHVAAREPSLEREVIDFMKDQLCTKDEQIKDLSGQLKGINELNIKLVGQNVHQAEHIHELLKLPLGTQPRADVVAKADNNESDFVSEAVNHDAGFDTSLDTSAPPVGNHSDAARGGQGSSMAA